MLMMNNKLKIKCFVEKTQKLTVCFRGASAEHKTPAVGRANYHQKYCYSILNISVVLIFLEYHSQCDISKQNIFISSVKLSVLTQTSLVTNLYLDNVRWSLEELQFLVLHHWLEFMQCRANVI